MAPRWHARQLQLELTQAGWVQKRGRSSSFRVAGWSSEQGQDGGKPELRRDGRIVAGDASRPRDREADSGFSDAVRRQLLVQVEWPELRLLRSAFVGRREWPELPGPVVHSDLQSEYRGERDDGERKRRIKTIIQIFVYKEFNN